MTDVLSSVWPEWHVVRVLGKGSYGIVYEAERNDASVKSSAAIKVITIPQNETEVSTLLSEGLTVDNAKTYYRGIVNEFVSEIRIMESLKGVQNIVSVEDYKVVEKTDRLGWDIYIRMELLTSFNDYLADHPFTENDIIDLGIDMCTALERCSRLNIIHRDIKPENIFVNNFRDFKLGDFGIARRLENTTNGMSIKGTYNYMAPEIERGEKYDSSVDTYSLGLVLYKLANDNRLPFLSAADQMNPNARVNAIRRRLNGEPLPPPCRASFELAQIIGLACQADPKKRFGSATAMKNALISIRRDQRTRLVAAPASISGRSQDMQTVSLQQNIYGETPQVNKRSPVKVVIPIIIGAAVLALLAVAAVLFIPSLSKEKKAASVLIEESASEEPGTVLEASTAEPAATAEETASGSETAIGSSAETTTTVPETTQREYTVGEVIKFGHYEQNDVTTDGNEEIEWIVLDVQDEGILVISRLGLDAQPYDTTGSKKVTWEQCTLRQWLNGYFLNTAFSPDEQTRIRDAFVPAGANPKHTDRGAGNDTWDKVFLLSITEAQNYFSSDADRKIQPTSYAISRGAKYCNNKDNQGYGYWWWLRSPGRDEDYAALVYPEGPIDYTGYHFNDTENVVRPAMWLSK
ncbi:MAG: serine/threonine-protein kinase [Lachnospiraceae bacterium]|nr:serine/threonine-protein kinase [Lachnospiraceae bacterium]